MVAKLVSCFPYVHLRNQDEFTNSPRTYEEWKTNFTNLIEQEIKIDTGVPTDLFLYYRFVDVNDNVGRDDIWKYDGVKTKNGTITVIDLQNDLTHGFSTIKYFLETHGQNYQYLLYQEDDLQFLNDTDGYLKESIDLLNAGEYDVISYTVAVSHITPHIGGMFGLFRIVPALYEDLGNFPMHIHDDEITINKWILSNLNCTFERIGYLPKYTNVPINAAKIGCFNQRYVAPLWKDGAFLFKVGS